MFFDQYNQATEEEITKNTASLLDQWALPKGMEILIHHFNKVLTYAFFSEEIITNGTLCTYVLTVVKNTGKYQ